MLKDSLHYFVQGLVNYYSADMTRAISALAEAKKTIRMANKWHVQVKSLK